MDHNTAVHEFDAKTVVPRYNWVVDLTELVVSRMLMATQTPYPAPQNEFKTRKYSSRMRTTCLQTVHASLATTRCRLGGGVLK